MSPKSNEWHDVIFGHYEPFSGSHVLCGWISGYEAEYMEKLPEDEIRHCITELIHTFTGESHFEQKKKKNQTG